MSERVLFYVDKDCAKRAFDIVTGILLVNGIMAPRVQMSCESKAIISKKPGKEWVSFIVDGDAADKANICFNNIDWKSAGITGFEKVEVGSAVETEVEIRLVGLKELQEHEVTLD